jgi:hypothetical protein
MKAAQALNLEGGTEREASSCVLLLAITYLSSVTDTALDSQVSSVTLPDELHVSASEYRSSETSV